MHLLLLGSLRGSGVSHLLWKSHNKVRGIPGLSDPQTVDTVPSPLVPVQLECGSRDGSRRIDRQESLLIDQLYPLISQAALCWLVDDVDGVRRQLSQR